MGVQSTQVRVGVGVSHWCQGWGQSLMLVSVTDARYFVECLLFSGNGCEQQPGDRTLASGLFPAEPEGVGGSCSPLL